MSNLGSMYEKQLNQFVYFHLSSSAWLRYFSNHALVLSQKTCSISMNKNDSSWKYFYMKNTYIRWLLTHIFSITKFPFIAVPLNETTYIRHSLGIVCEWLCISLELSGSYLQTKQTSIHISKHKKEYLMRYWYSLTSPHTFSLSI